MSTSGPESTSSDPQRVRLSWPGGPRAAEATPSVSAEGQERRERVAAEPQIDDGGRFDASLQPGELTIFEPEPGLGSSVRRAMVQGYDRLADRLLQRLRAVHEDLDGSLAELRSDVNGLRQSVEELGDRAQVRSVRASIDELRSDVAGLRRAPLESPELERVGGDLAALRAGMSDIAGRLQSLGERDPALPDASLTLVVERVDELRAEVAQLAAQVAGVRDRPAPVATPLGSLAPLLSEIAALRSDLPSRADVAAELSALREEVASLRRRIPLRARSDLT